MALNQTVVWNFVSRVSGLDALRRFGSGLTMAGAAAQGATVSLMGVARAAAISIGVFAAGAIAAVMLGKTYFGLAQEAGDFAQNLASLGAVARVNADGLRAMEREVKRVAIATKFTPTQALTGMTELTQRGIGAAQSIFLLRHVLDLTAASADKLSIEKAAGVVGQLVRGYGVAVEEVPAILDKLARMTQITGAKFTDFPNALGLLQRGFSAAGQSVEDMIIMFGMTRDVLPQLERGMTSISATLQQLTDEKKLKKLSKTFGIDAIDRATGRFRRMPVILLEMAAAMDNMDESSAKMAVTHVFGSKAVQSLFAMLQQLRSGVRVTSGEFFKGADLLKYYERNLADSTGTLKMFRDAQLATWKGQMQINEGLRQTLRLSLGQAVQETFLPMLRGVNAVLKTVAELFEALPLPVKKTAIQFSLLTPIVVALAGALMTLSVVLYGIIPLIKTRLLPMLAGMGFTMGPIIAAFGKMAIVVAAVAAVMAALFAVWKLNLGDIQGRTQRALITLSLYFDGLKQSLETGTIEGPTAGELIKEDNKGILTAILGTGRFLMGMKNMALGFMEAMAPIMEPLKEGFGAVWDIVTMLAHAFVRVGVALGILDEESLLSQNMWKGFGKILGWLTLNILYPFVKAFELIAKVVRWVVGVIDSLVGSLVAVLDTIKAIFAFGTSIATKGFSREGLAEQRKLASQATESLLTRGVGIPLSRIIAEPIAAFGDAVSGTDTMTKAVQAAQEKAYAETAVEGIHTGFRATRLSFTPIGGNNPIAPTPGSVATVESMTRDAMMAAAMRPAQAAHAAGSALPLTVSLVLDSEIVTEKVLRIIESNGALGFRDPEASGSGI